MKKIKLDDLETNPITQFGSVGASITHLLRSDRPGHIAVIELQPGGKLGMHEAVEDQLFVIISGSGVVSVLDSEPMPVGADTLIYWHAGENHETIAGSDGLSGFVVEGEEIGEHLQFR
jgi:mannose-6-phosphate isomerase-like protein (cupin superfamily)